MKFLKLFDEFNWVSMNHGFDYNDKIIKTNITYHTTPLSNLHEIEKNGLTINSPLNKLKTTFDFPNEPKAVYMTDDLYGVIRLSRLLFLDKKIKDDWIILKIDTNGINLYRDPLSIREGGLYTTENITPNRISKLTIIDFDIIKTITNWSKFWNWWFWKKKEKPNFVKKFSLEQYKNKE